MYSQIPSLLWVALHCLTIAKNSVSGSYDNPVGAFCFFLFHDTLRSECVFQMSISTMIPNAANNSITSTTNGSHQLTYSPRQQTLPIHQHHPSGDTPMITSSTFPCKQRRQPSLLGEFTDLATYSITIHPVYAQATQLRWPLFTPKEEVTVPSHLYQRGNPAWSG